MNTKTMRLPPRRVSMLNNKRKERDDFVPKRLNPPLTKKLTKSTGSLAGSDKAAAHVLPVPSNKLLAGYLAHEFLTQGTLFGQAWDPARLQQNTAESSKSIGDDANPEKRSRSAEAEPKREPKEKEKEKRQRYVEVASLLKANGAHIPGIVNPSQLARFLEM